MIKIVQDTGMLDDCEAINEEMNMEDGEEVVEEPPEIVEELVEVDAKRKEVGNDLKGRIASKLEATRRRKEKYLEEERRRLNAAYMEVTKKNEAEGRKNEARNGMEQDGGQGAAKKAKEGALGATASRRGARTTPLAKVVGRRSSR